MEDMNKKDINDEMTNNEKVETVEHTEVIEEVVEEAPQTETVPQVEETPQVEEKKKEAFKMPEIKISLQKKDWILIGVVVIVAAIAFLLHSQIGVKASNCVTIKVAGEIAGVYSLADDQEIEINNGSNILIIKNGKADMLEADCPDKLCVHQRAISKDNESIICLPNKVIVEVDSSENSEFDAVAN